MTELRNEVILLTAERDRARVQAATLAAENRRLRRMTANGKQGRILHRAAADARQLVGWRFAGYSISRRNALSYGMSERRHAWAVALLRVAGILAIDSKWTDAFSVDELDDCHRRLDRAVVRVETNGISMLIFRMPRGKARG